MEHKTINDFFKNINKTKEQITISELSNILLKKFKYISHSNKVKDKIQKSLSKYLPVEYITIDTTEDTIILNASLTTGAFKATYLYNQNTIVLSEVKKSVEIGNNLIEKTAEYVIDQIKEYALIDKKIQNYYNIKDISSSNSNLKITIDKKNNIIQIIGEEIKIEYNYLYERYDCLNITNEQYQLSFYENKDTLMDRILIDLKDCPKGIHKQKQNNLFSFLNHSEPIEYTELIKKAKQESLNIATAKAEKEYKTIETYITNNPDIIYQLNEPFSLELLTNIFNIKIIKTLNIINFKENDLIIISISTEEYNFEISNKNILYSLILDLIYNDIKNKENKLNINTTILLKGFTIETFIPMTTQKEKHIKDIKNLLQNEEELRNKIICNYNNPQNIKAKKRI